MKNLILFLILLGLGGWYCYDKYGDKLAPLTNSLRGSAVSVSDPRFVEIEAEAKKLFPTKVSERDSWIALQTRSLQILDAYKPPVSPEVYSEILADAKLKFGARFDKLLDYVRSQCSAAEDINAAMLNSRFTKEEIVGLLKSAKAGFGCDYVSARASLQRVISAYSEIKRRSAGLSPQDYDKIEPKFIGIIYKSPEHALEIFNIYALARHNYLTKTIPAYYGNLREGIEETIPDDFVEQLKELNRRLDDSNRRGKKASSLMALNGSAVSVSGFAAAVLRKYIYNVQRGGLDYCAAFVEVKGKKILALPFDALDENTKSVSVDIGGGEKFSSDAVYISKKSGMAICIPKTEPNCTAFPSYTRKEIFDGGKIDAEIVGLDKRGARCSVLATVEDGKLRFPSGSDKEKLARRMTSGAVIVELNTSKLVGFLDIVSPNADEFFGAQKERFINEVFGEKEGLKKWNGLKSVADKFAKCLSDDYAEFQIAFVDDLAAVSKFNTASFKLQKEQISKLCMANYAAFSFLLVDSYGADRKTALIAPVADRYERIFQTGSRISVEKLYSEYSNYMRDILFSLKNNVSFVSKNFENELYFGNKPKASLQVSIFSDLLKMMSEAGKSFDKKKFVHNDISEKIEGTTYIPPNSEFQKPSAKGIGGPMRLSN